MRLGNFAAAWNLSDLLLNARTGAPDARLPRRCQSIWTGAPLDGRRVLVRCYHGLGDTIQFVRYVPMLRPRVRELIVWAQPALIPLLQGVSGIDRLIPLHDGDVDVEYDVDVEIMELPHVFRTAIDTIPRDVPYVRVSPAAIERTSGPAVGLVWRAGDWAHNRSIPFDLLAPLLDAPVTWYLLQGGSGLHECPPGVGIAAGTDDILEAAQVIRSLDLLITIDSMPAHLAGALAAPVWTLLPADADWRWMTGRDDSPWYPTMRLFRQEREGQWEAAIARVAAALKRSEPRRLHTTRLSAGVDSSSCDASLA
jgi:hypothetical protein